MNKNKTLMKKDIDLGFSDIMGGIRWAGPDDNVGISNDIDIIE